MSTPRKSLIDNLFEIIHDALIQKYFVLADGRAVYINFTYFVSQLFGDGPTLLNNGMRHVHKLYPGLGWAQIVICMNYYIVLIVADIPTFKWGMHSRVHAHARHTSRQCGVEIALSTLLPTDLDVLVRPLPLPPRVNVKMCNLLDKFAEAAQAEPHAALPRWNVRVDTIQLPR